MYIDERAYALKLFKQKWSLEMIARDLGYTKQTVGRWIKEQGYNLRTRKYIGIPRTKTKKKSHLAKYHNIELWVGERFTVETLCGKICVIDHKPDDEQYRHRLANGEILYFQKIIQSTTFNENSLSVVLATSRRIAKHLNENIY